MFAWLKSIADNFRIAFDYVEYESDCKQKWVADAERIYATVHLIADIKNRMVEPLRHAEVTFEEPLRDLKSKRENVFTAVVKAQETWLILNRDVRPELDAAHKLKEEVAVKLEACKVSLSSAHSALNSAKNSLDSWYARAEGNWIGNGGKKLPSYSFFGQDTNDRDVLKARLASAGSEIGRLKSERSRLFHDLKAAREKIARIEEARQRRFDLIKEGFDKRIVTSVIKNGTQDMCAIDEKIAALEKARDEFIPQAKMSLGIYMLEAEIDQLVRAKQARLNSYNDEESLRERKAKHRAAWQESHGS